MGTACLPSPWAEALTQAVVRRCVWKVTIRHGPEGGARALGTGGKGSGRRGSEGRVCLWKREGWPHHDGRGCLRSGAADAYVPRRLGSVLPSAGPAAESKMRDAGDGQRRDLGVWCDKKALTRGRLCPSDPQCPGDSRPADGPALRCWETD